MLAYDLLKFGLSISASKVSVIVKSEAIFEELWNNIGDVFKNSVLMFNGNVVLTLYTLLYWTGTSCNCPTIVKEPIPSCMFFVVLSGSSLIHKKQTLAPLKSVPLVVPENIRLPAESLASNKTLEKFFRGVSPSGSAI